MVELKLKKQDKIKLPNTEILNELEDKIEIENISYNGVKYLKNVVCSVYELKNLNNICDEIKRKENEIKVKNILEIMNPSNIEDFSNILNINKY